MPDPASTASVASSRLSLRSLERSGAVSITTSRASPSALKKFSRIRSFRHTRAESSESSVSLSSRSHGTRNTPAGVTRTSSRSVGLVTLTTSGSPRRSSARVSTRRRKSPWNTLGACPAAISRKSLSLPNRSRKAR